MTLRQKKLGVTEWGYTQGITDGEFLANFEAFKAKASTLKKGQYHGLDLIKAWLPEMASYEYSAYIKLQQAQPFLFGLDATMHEHFIYTATHDLDLLTVR